MNANTWMINTTTCTMNICTWEMNTSTSRCCHIHLEDECHTWKMNAITWKMNASTWKMNSNTCKMNPLCQE